MKTIKISAFILSAFVSFAAKPIVAQVASPYPKPGPETEWEWKPVVPSPSSGVNGPNRVLYLPKGYALLGGTFGQPTFTNPSKDKNNKPTFYLGLRDRPTGGRITIDAGMQWESADTSPAGWSPFMNVSVFYPPTPQNPNGSRYRLTRNLAGKIRVPRNSLGNTYLETNLDSAGRLSLILKNSWIETKTNTNNPKIGPITIPWTVNSKTYATVPLNENNPKAVQVLSSIEGRRVVGLTQGGGGRILGSDSAHYAVVKLDESSVKNLTFNVSKVGSYAVDGSSVKLSKTTPNWPQGKSQLKPDSAAVYTTTLAQKTPGLPPQVVLKGKLWIIDFVVPQPRKKNEIGTYVSGFSNENVVIQLPKRIDIVGNSDIQKLTHSAVITP